MNDYDVGTLVKCLDCQGEILIERELVGEDDTVKITARHWEHLGKKEKETARERIKKGEVAGLVARVVGHPDWSGEVFIERKVSAQDNTFDIVARDWNRLDNKEKEKLSKKYNL